MNLSSIGSASPTTSGFLSEPPLSPGAAPAPAPAPFPQLRTVDPVPASDAAPGPEPQAPPTHVAPAPPVLAPTAPTVEGSPAAPSSAPTLESTLLRMRLVTPDQIASAMREEAETGRPLAEIVVANGWVSADDLARLHGGAPAPAPAAPAADPPAPAPVAAPSPEPPPAAEVAPAPAEAPVAPSETRTGIGARVLVRLQNGERIDVRRFDDLDTAKSHAHGLMSELRHADDWPFLGGRYVRPQAILSVDIEPTGF